MSKHDNTFKYKMIALLCDGKSAGELEREYSVTDWTILRWLRSFVSDGFFNENELSPEEKVNLEKLRENATRKAVEIRYKNTSTDISLIWALELDEELEEWRLLAEEWLKTQVRSKDRTLSILSVFFKNILSTMIFQGFLKSFFR